MSNLSDATRAVVLDQTRAIFGDRDSLPEHEIVARITGIFRFPREQAKILFYSWRECRAIEPTVEGGYFFRLALNL